MGGVSRELPACLMVMIMMDSKSGPVLVIAVDIAGREEPALRTSRRFSSDMERGVNLNLCDRDAVTTWTELGQLEFTEFQASQISNNKIMPSECLKRNPNNEYGQPNEVCASTIPFEGRPLEERAME
ncbi:hypothetical protein RRG08_018977 [Elysia crispata]|uniref:Uncharacterized protein n=1 Tax=Elysia crispata TaxID=231223 RepID=A0AAE1DSF2_9GAST|nr:hypothetical protein RRG08_018977 [Elysia crispata]